MTDKPYDLAEEERHLLHREQMFQQRLAAARHEANSRGDIFRFEEESDLWQQILHEFPVPPVKPEDRP